MKAQIKAIVASAVVIALCLAAVGGVTYSWFSDSEESDITINTAKVDYEITSIDIGNIVGYANAAVGTNNTIQITNLAAACTIPIQINITNNSTIETIYVVKAVFSDTTTDDEETWDEVKINGTPIRSAMEQTGDKIILLTEDWTVASPSIGFSIPLRITSTEQYGSGEDLADEWASTQRSIIFSIEIEAYQGDKPVSSFGSIAGISESAATVPSNGIISGTIEMTEGESTQDVTTTVEFSSSNTYTASGSSEATNTSGTNLGTSITKSGDAINVGLTLYENTSAIDSPTFSAPVTVSLVIPGDLTNNNTTVPSVTYNGTGTDPSNVTAFYDGTNTTITFDVDHFSTFIIKPVKSISTETELKNSIGTEKTIILKDDIPLTSPLTIDNDISIIGNGHKIYGDTITVEAENVSLKGIRFACTSEMTSGDKSMIYVREGNKTMLIDGCYFEDSQWDVIQYTSKDGTNLTITNCTFDDSLVNFNGIGKDSYGNSYVTPSNVNRYIHIEPREDGNYVLKNINVTITNNVFKIKDKTFGDSVFTIYGIPTSCMTFGNNIFDLPIMNAQIDPSIKNGEMYWISDGLSFNLIDPYYLISGIPELGTNSPEEA